MAETDSSTQKLVHADDTARGRAGAGGRQARRSRRARRGGAGVPRALMTARLTAVNARGVDVPFEALVRRADSRSDPGPARRWRRPDPRARRPGDPWRGST